MVQSIQMNFEQFLKETDINDIKEKKFNRIMKIYQIQDDLLEISRRIDFENRIENLTAEDYKNLRKELNTLLRESYGYKFNYYADIDFKLRMKDKELKASNMIYKKQRVGQDVVKYLQEQLMSFEDFSERQNDFDNLLSLIKIIQRINDRFGLDIKPKGSVKFNEFNAIKGRSNLEDLIKEEFDLADI